MVWKRFQTYFSVRAIHLNSMFLNFCHLLKYGLKENVRFIPKDEIPEEYYQTVKNPSQPNPGEEVVFLYALLEIDMANELDSFTLNCQNKPVASQKERYDAQYSTLSELAILSKSTNK